MVNLLWIELNFSYDSPIAHVVFQHFCSDLVFHHCSKSYHWNTDIGVSKFTTVWMCTHEQEWVNLSSYMEDGTQQSSEDAIVSAKSSSNSNWSEIRRYIHFHFHFYCNIVNKQFVSIIWYNLSSHNKVKTQNRWGKNFLSSAHTAIINKGGCLCLI